MEKITRALLSAGVLGLFLSIVCPFMGTGVQAATSADGMYNYEVDAAGNAVLTGYLGTAVDVAVPSSVDGYVVTALSGTYQGKNQMTKVTIPNTVNRINDTAFAGCTAMQSFEVAADNVTYCSSDEGALMSKDQTTMVRYPVARHIPEGSYTIPSTVVTVAGYAYEGFSTPNLVIPANVVTIADYAFANPGNFTTITSWAEGTKLVGTYAFYKCVNLNATLPASVNTIGVYAFAYSTNIQIDISKCTLTEIADYLFYECDNMHNLTLPEGIATVGAYAFYKCNNLNEVKIPASVTSIKEGAFAQCTNLHTVEIPEGVTSIENNMFDGCQNLNTVVLPSTLNNIGDNAFSGCQNIHSINIPENVTHISDSSFAGVDTSKIGLTTKVARVKLIKAQKKGKKVKLTWKKASGVTGYLIYRSNKKGKGYKKVKMLTKGSATSYTDAKVKKGKKYYYKVRAYKLVAGEKCLGKFSGVKSVKC